MLERVSNIIEFSHDGLGDRQIFSERASKSLAFGAARSEDVNIWLLDDANYLERSIAKAYSKYVAIVSDLGFYFLRDCTLRGRGFLFLDNHLLDRRDLIPQWVALQIDKGLWHELYPDRPQPTRRIIDPVVLLTSESYLIYGHWLLDALPKAWLYKALLGNEVEGFKFLLPHDTPRYALSILTDIFEFNSECFEYYNWREEDIILDKAVVPSLLHDNYIFHPITKLYVDFILTRCGIETSVSERRSGSFEDGELIYVSRHHFKDTLTKRRITNEDKVHSILLENGFKIVCPEELSWTEQVRIFAKAKIIVGEGGSALHNAFFSKKNAVVLCFRPNTHVQATIGALRGQTLFLLCPTEETNNEGSRDFKIDELRLASALDTCRRISTGVH